MSNFILGNFEQLVVNPNYYSSWGAVAQPGYFTATGNEKYFTIRDGGGYGTVGLFRTATLRLFSGVVPEIATIDSAASGNVRSASLLLTTTTAANIVQNTTTTGRASLTFNSIAASATGTATWFTLEITPVISTGLQAWALPSTTNVFYVGTVGTTGTPDLLLADANITQGVIYTLPNLSIKMTPNVAEF